MPSQGCTLAALGGLWHLTFALGQPEKNKSHKSYAGHPAFHKFRELGSLQFFLEHSLGSPYEFLQVSLVLTGNRACWNFQGFASL